MEKNEQIVKKEIGLLQNGRPIILFGAGAVGKLVKQHLDKMEIKTAAFCDNNVKLQGAIIEDIQVYSMEQIKEEYPEALVIKCSCFNPSLKSITKQLVNNNYMDSIEGLAIVYALKIGWREKIVEKENLIKRCDELVSGTEQGFIRSVEFDITEKCTLRCRDCANMIPYFTAPQHYDADEIIEGIERLAASVKGIGRLMLLGGETFLHPELTKIIQAAAKIENIISVQVITNGTLIPSEQDLEIMAKYLTDVAISDYGSLSRRKDELIAALEKYHIIYEIRSQGREWYSLGKPIKKGRSAEKNGEVFQKCRWAKNCLSVIKGEFRLCPHANYGTMLGAIPKNPLDYVNILDEIKTPSEIGEMIKYLLTNTQYITACDYCNGSADAEIVGVAIQMKS